MISLEEIQKMWNIDSQIDPDNLHQESLKIPVLHAKYYDIFNNIILLKAKAEQQTKNIRHNRYEYFSGKRIQMYIKKIPFLKRFVIKKQ